MPRPSTTLSRELRTIRQSFQNLAKAFQRLQPALAALRTQPAGNGKTTRRPPSLTAKQRAALKLQGKYMGTMRGLPAAKRAMVKKVRAEKGIRAAIAEARRIASQASHS